jgi:hypothetical protein
MKRPGTAAALSRGHVLRCRRHLVNRLERLSLQEPQQSAISHADSLPSTVPDTNRNHRELVGMALQ